MKNKVCPRWDSNPRPPALAASVLPLDQWCPNKNPKGPHSIGAKNSSIQNLWKILRPKGPVGPAGPVMDNTALDHEGLTVENEQHRG